MQKIKRTKSNTYVFFCIMQTKKTCKMQNCRKKLNKNKQKNLVRTMHCIFTCTQYSGHKKGRYIMASQFLMLLAFPVLMVFSGVALELLTKAYKPVYVTGSGVVYGGERI